MIRSIDRNFQAVLLSFAIFSCSTGAMANPDATENTHDYYTIKQIEIHEFGGDDTRLGAPLQTTVIELDWNDGIPASRPAPLPGGFTTLPTPIAPLPGTITPLPGTYAPPAPGYPSSPIFGPAPLITNMGWDPGTMITLGKAAWDVVVANKPAVNVKTDKIDVLPAGNPHWSDIQGWSIPRTETYEMVFRNWLNIPVIDITYRIIYTHSGNQAGRGHYLANVTVVPTAISVLWGFDFSMVTSIANVTNAGSSADPLAAVELLVQWKVLTPLLNRQGSSSYYVRGDGQFLQF